MFAARSCIRAFGKVPLILAFVLSLAAPVVVGPEQQTPNAREPVIVLAAPWRNAWSLATHADGRLIAPGRIEAVALVWSDNPEFRKRLYDAGAWLVLSGDLSTLLCKVSE